jgi:AraC-like DNA-binding protein
VVTPHRGEKGRFDPGRTRHRAQIIPVFSQKRTAPVTAKRARQPQEKRSVGRPAFEPTQEQRNRVKVKAFARTREQKIAADLGIDPKTLRKYFKEELANGRADVRSMVWEKQVIAALTGTNPTDRYYVLNNPDDANVLDVPAVMSSLKISFQDGGPGRPRRVPFSLPDGADTLGVLERPDNPDRLDAASQSFLPPSSAPPSSGPTASPSPPVQEPQQQVTRIESVRQMSPAELMAHNADPTVVAVIEPDRDIHVHTPKVDSPCSRCRQLWVQQP